jgi:hypothetical protein
MERKLSKKMPQREPSRPPLTSRIRASFESKRTKSDVSSPTALTHGFVTQQPDPDVLHTAVQDVMNSETFQNAIAANLAKLLKPTIKSALDTIQPVVEAVYNHEMLLRKTNQNIETARQVAENTNQSVENLLDRLDTVTERTEEDGSIKAPMTPASSPRKRALSSFSGPPQTAENIKHMLEENNALIATKLSELSGSLEANKGKTTDTLESLKAFSEQSSTATSVMQAQLDQLKVDVGEIMAAIGADLGTNVKALSERAPAQETSVFAEHSAKLDAISVHLEGLKGISGAAPSSDNAELLQHIASNFEDLKQHVDAGRSVSNDQISTVLTAVEAHSADFAEIKAAIGDPNGEILAAVQKSNDSHAAHAVILGELKERSITPGSESAPVSSDPEVTSSLQAIQNDIAALKENLKANALPSNDWSSANLEPQITTILATLESHTAALGEIKASHASHATTLKGIKSLEGAPSGGGGDSASLEPQISTIITTLESHTATLANLQEAHATHATALEEIKPLEGAPVTDGGNLVNLEPQIAAIISTLETHTATLGSLQDSHTSHAAALDGIKSIDVSAGDVASTATIEPHIAAIIATLDSHTATLGSLQDSHAAHATALDSLKALDPAPASSGDSSTLEPQIAAIIATLESHTATLGELKSSGTPPSSDVAPVAATVNMEGLESQIAAIHATLESHTTLLTEIKDDVSAEILTSLHEINSAHASQNATLLDIKEADVSAEILTALHASNDSHADHTATLSALQAAVQSSNDAHASHAGVLDEIKSTRSIEPAAGGDAPTSSGLDAQMGTIMSTLEQHHMTLADIKNASKSANDLHASHIAALTELKSVQPSGDSPASEGGNADFGALEAHITTIISTLEGQNATLSDIKESSASPEVVAAVKETHELLQSHTSLLDTILDASSHEDILANISSLKQIIEESMAGVDEHGASVKELRESTKASHSEIATALGALALGGAAGAGVEALASNGDGNLTELLEEMKAVRAIVEKSSETTASMAAQLDINHKTFTTSITALGDELKAEVDFSSTEIASAVTMLSGDVRSIDLSSMSIAVSECGREINGLSAKIDGVEESLKGTRAHVVDLKDGFHLSDRGVGQLKEHALIAGAAGLATGGAAAVVTEESKPTIERSPVEPEVTDPEANETTIETQAEPEASEPIVEEAPIPEESEPVVEDTQPEPAAREPIVEKAPVAEESEPVADIQPEPEASGPIIAEAPVAEDSEPVVEDIQPEPETSEPIDEEAPESEKSEPVVDDTQPEPEASDHIIDEDPAIEGSPTEHEATEPDTSEPVVEGASVAENSEPTVEESYAETEVSVTGASEPVVEEASIPEESQPVEESPVEPEVNEPLVEEAAVPKESQPVAVEPVVKEAFIPEESEPATEESPAEPESSEFIVEEASVPEDSKPVIEEAQAEAEGGKLEPRESVEETEEAPALRIAEEPLSPREEPEDIPVYHDGAHVDGHALDETLHEEEDATADEPHPAHEDPEDAKVREEIARINAEFMNANADDPSHEAEPTQREIAPVEEPEESEEPLDPSSPFIEDPVSPTGTAVHDPLPNSPIEDPFPSPAIDEPLASPMELESGSGTPLSATFPSKSKKGKKGKKAKKPWEEDDDAESAPASASASASTSAIASPLSPDFPDGSGGGRKKKGKKGRKEFVFEPEGGENA